MTIKNLTKQDWLRILIIGGIVLVITIAAGSGFDKPVTPADSPAPVVGPSPTTTTEETNASGENNIVAGEQETNSDLVKVIRVIDGDTIEIEGGEHIRYIGIDTPETVDPRKPVQCFGVEASAKNKELVDGKEVRLEKDITDRDKYNRLLRYVYIGDTFVNLELVKQGFASSYSYPPDIKYQDHFVQAQEEARNTKRGLWNACQIEPASAPTTAAPPATSSDSSSDSCIIKGNISSSNEKIYHVPGCGSYNATKIDESRGERWFCAESEALAAGWRKALNCP